ncbi:MAG: hypothetical protein ACR2ME_11195 [Acidimicrobiia bacterium]
MNQEVVAGWVVVLDVENLGDRFLGKSEGGALVPPEAFRPDSDEPNGEGGSENQQSDNDRPKVCRGDT